MKQKWKQDYNTFQSDFTSLQNEIYLFVEALRKKESTKIDISNIYKRSGIKSFQSIEKNYKNGHYRDKSNLLDLEDIAGIRIICHCEDDVLTLKQRLKGELQQKQYLKIEEKKKPEENNEQPYRATHITFAKNITKNGKTYRIFCEIQIRTVMADAWAIQNHKYLYKKIEEGETNELTSAVSEIMNGCEKLWSLVKKKSISYKEEHTKIKKKKFRKMPYSTSKSISSNNRVEKWFKSHRETASRGLQKLGIKTFMEVEIRPLDSDVNISGNELKEGAKRSEVRIFGWPIAIFFEHHSDSPKPDPQDGIYAEISIDKDNPIMSHISYDYWAIHSSGSFYLKKSLFEDQREPDQIFFNTRIVRITEIFMYIKNLYSHFNVPVNNSIRVMIKHGGLKGRTLSSSYSNRHPLSRRYKATNEVASKEICTTLEKIENNMTDMVEKFTSPLFEQFNFFELNKSILQKIVSNYLQGKLS